MRFCPKCNGMMMPARSGGRTVLRCRACGYEEEISGDTPVRIYRVRTKLAKTPQDKIYIIGKGAEVEVLPKTRTLCPECGNPEAYYWELQTRGADEPATRFFKCARCGHVWREYQ